MGAPDAGIQAAEQGTADTLLSALRTINPQERARHANIVDYWLSIRGNKEFPPLHDLDPLEISDAGPHSILLELISGGQDAEIRHLGDGLNEFCATKRVIDAPNPSVLHSISTKLPIVAISRDILAFEDDFSGVAGRTRCWVTLLPLSSCGSWVDYVYAFVTVETAASKAGEPPVKSMVEHSEPVAECDAGEPVESAEIAFDDSPEEPGDAPEVTTEPEAIAQPEELEHYADAVEESFELEEAVEPTKAASAPGFSRLLEGAAKLAGFYGQGVPTDDVVPTMELKDSAPPTPESVDAVPDAEELPPLELEDVEPAAELAEIEEPSVEAPIGEREEQEPAKPEAEAETAPVEPETAVDTVSEHVDVEEPEPAPAVEGPLQEQLAQVRAKAEEARQAQLRVTQALHESLSAAYDFALDAEGSPEEYLRLVEAQGVRIQLRAPMAPVAKMAFDDVCDAATIRQFESVLAWALKVELPRGALLERIESAGGIPELLNEFSKAA